MKRTSTERAYMAAAVENASPAGLVVILMDLLVSDLKQAIAAMQNQDIEKRSAELKHGFMVLQQLQECLDMEKGGDAAKHLSLFYSVIRSRMLEAQLQKDARILERQIELLLQVRQAWQQVDTKRPAPAAGSPTPSANVSPQITPAKDEDTQASWTA